MATVGSLMVNMGLESASFISGLKRASTETTRAMKGIQTQMRLAQAAIGAFIGSKMIAGIGRMADEWSDLSARVGLAVGDMSQAPAMMKQIADVADRTYSDLSLTAEAFIENGRALKELGYSTQSQLNYTEALNSALVVSGAKGERAASVQRALAKAMAVGNLDAVGLQAVLSNGGRVAEALAAKLGTTTNGLRQMSKDGKITSQVIAGALLGSFEDLQAEAESMPATIEDGFLKIRNALKQLVGEADKASGFSEGLAKGLVSVSTAIKDNIPALLTGLQHVAAAMVAVATVAGGRFVKGLALSAVALVRATGVVGLFSAALRAVPGMLIVTAITAIVDVTISLTRQFGGVAEALKFMWNTARVIFDAMKLGISAQVDYAKALGLSIKGIFSDDAKAQADALWAQAGEKRAQSFAMAKTAATGFWESVKAGARGGMDAIGGAIDATDKLNTALKGLDKDALKKAAEAAKKLREEWESLLDRLQPWRAPTREYREAIALIDLMGRQAGMTTDAILELRRAAMGQWLDATGFKAVELSLVKLDTSLQAVDALPDNLKAISDNIHQMLSDMDRPFAAMADFGKEIGSNLSQAIVYGQDLGKALVNSIKATVAEIMANKFARMLFGDGSKLGGGGLIGGLLTGIGFKFGGARASGGPVQAGKAYLVGEKGPEMLVPGTAAHVMSNAQAFGGASGTVINIDARQATDPQAILQAVRAAVTISNQHTDARFDRAMRINLRSSPGAA